MATLNVARENIRHAPRLEVGAIVLALLDRVEDWVERHHQRLTLAEMTEDQLKDVGLSAADVERETTKPFWQA